MAANSDPIRPLGWKAAPFDLPGVDGKRHTLESARGPNGLVVMFICNHCPYVLAVADRIARDAKELAAHGMGMIAINSNDATDYPEDSFANMPAFAARHGFSFPYVHDEPQAVARDYLAVCTPDPFGFDRDLRLVYHGRIDDSGRNARPGAKRELFDAMVDVAKTGKTSAQQLPSVGCSIKWK